MLRGESYFKGLRGSDLFYQTWTEPKARGTLVWTHGIGEHSESYTRLAEGLEGSGWNLAVPDLRGHGRSAGPRGVVHEFSDYRDDLDAFLRHLDLAKEGRPWILGGHSMGALIVLTWCLEDHDSSPAAVVLSSPLLGLRVKVPAFKKKAASLLAQYAPTLTLFNELKPHQLTRDSKVLDEYARDPLRHDRISAPLYMGMLAAMSHVQENAAQIQLPLLIQAAGDDEIVDLGSTQEFFKNLASPQKKMEIYERFRHEIFNEIDRAHVFKDLRRWLELWTPKKN